MSEANFKAKTEGDSGSDLLPSEAEATRKRARSADLVIAEAMSPVFDPANLHANIDELERGLMEGLSLGNACV